MTEVERRNGRFTEGLQLLKELEMLGVADDKALYLDRTDITFDQAMALATMAGEVKRRSSWIIGDLLVYSELRWSDTWPQIAHATGLAESTLENLASISRKIPPERRRPELGHSLHADVAPLPPREQERWLAKAEKHGWGKQDLREHLRAAKGDERKTLRQAAQDVVRDAALDGEQYTVPVGTLEDLREAL